tara:strand:- start:513 stop:719 length:207 start_codon:yes stop_codon:yes gene_type:complete
MNEFEYNPNEDISEVNMSDIEQIELILMEANAHGLRQEVQGMAAKFMQEDPNLTQLDATVMAYSEWIK